MSRSRTILKGTLILTATGLTTRVIGFFYRIFLSHTIGESGVGLYQLIFPVYALGFSITCAGIETALSRCIAKHVTLNNKKRVQDLFFTAIVLTLVFSLLFTLLLQRHAANIAVNFLHHHSTENMLILLSYIFPFASVHSCITGYYIGIKNIKIPAFAQLFEQISRVGFVFLVYTLNQKHHTDFSISFAVLGLITGEITSSLYCIKKLSGKILPVHFPNIHRQDIYSSAKELLSLSLPLTTSRVLLNLLQSVEAVSIPISLQIYGMTENQSLRIYGVLTGMALPCILFPSAITNAISTMLLPTVSEIQALNDIVSLRKIIFKSCIYCTLLGFACCITFLIIGPIAGNLLFKSTLAGKFILTLAWICPFLYTNGTLLSIINGIGRTFLSLCINIINLSIRIFYVIYAIPLYGIHGYMCGLLFSQIISFLLSTFYLFKIYKPEVNI